MIPKIIHQIWIGPKPPPKRWMESWRQKHPGWDYRLWDNARVRDFPMANRAKFQAVEEWCGKADILRYEILHRYGGFYADADSLCLAPLDDGFLEHDSFACYESERFAPGLIANGYLGAAPGNALMHALIERIGSRPRTSAPDWKQFGPVFLTDEIRRLGYTRIHVFPSHYFIPRHYRDEDEYAGPGPVYARQFWASTRVGPYGGLGKYDQQPLS